MHESSTEAIHPYKKCWNPGTLQLVATQTIILSSCQDNTQFYCHLIYVINIYCHTNISFVLLYLFIFVHYFLTFLYISIFISTFYTSLFIGCRLTIKSSVFLILLTRERLFNFSMRYAVLPLPELQPRDSVHVKLDQQKVWKTPGKIIAGSTETPLKC